MKKLQFKTEIIASAKKVYNTMLGIDNIETYEQWTAEFNPTSTYEGNWDKGSKIYFVGTDENGKRGGMVSEIANNVPYKFVSIRHYGILDGKNEITEGPDVEKWAGGLENYTFEEHNGVTTVTIESDVDEEYLDYFNTTWSKALNKLKELSEN
ncbi:SRPBCC domain-containing protein [Winogradskyella poriferorum]|uniref:SRPBCC domain-containing protein n=1 Tax=Winogradskyella poriferorum TaxID=307627 RepID=UPI003D65CB7E